MVCTESDGQDAIELMSMIGYDICIPGNHEFDYGMEAFLDYAENSDATFLSCNLSDEESGESVFDGYQVVTYNVGGQEFRVGYVAFPHRRRLPNPPPPISRMRMETIFTASARIRPSSCTQPYRMRWMEPLPTERTAW